MDIGDGRPHMAHGRAGMASTGLYSTRGRSSFPHGGIAIDPPRIADEARLCPRAIGPKSCLPLSSARANRSSSTKNPGSRGLMERSGLAMRRQGFHGIARQALFRAWGGIRRARAGPVMMASMPRCANQARKTSTSQIRARPAGPRRICPGRPQVPRRERDRGRGLRIPRKGQLRRSARRRSKGRKPSPTAAEGRIPHPAGTRYPFARAPSPASGSRTGAPVPWTQVNRRASRSKMQRRLRARGHSAFHPVHPSTGPSVNEPRYLPYTMPSCSERADCGHRQKRMRPVCAPALRSFGRDGIRNAYPPRPMALAAAAYGPQDGPGAVPAGATRRCLPTAHDAGAQGRRFPPQEPMRSQSGSVGPPGRMSRRIRWTA